MAVFKSQVDLVQDAVQRMHTAARPADASPEAAATAQTAQAAAEDMRNRTVVDLLDVAQKLDKQK